MTHQELDLTADIIDTRDIIARVEDLKSLKDDHETDPEGGHWSDEDAQDLDTLTAILDDLKGYGGDEQWRGDWYPLTLINESHFVDYCQDLVCDCYDLKGIPTFVHIDWEATSREMRVDYSEVTIDGVTYFYR